MASKLHNALAKKLPDIQMSEAFINCVFLAMSGGLQDAYTYFTRNEVFSNAQTGNVVLMSTHFMMGEWYQGLKYLLPFLAFGLGVFVTERIQGKYKNATRLHWRQAILLIEIVILIAVGFMPHSMDMFATIIVSFSCAMQVQAFRKVNGNRRRYRWKPFNAVRNPHNMDFKCTAFNQRTSYVCGEIKNII